MKGDDKARFRFRVRPCWSMCSAFMDPVWGEGSMHYFYAATGFVVAEEEDGRERE